MDMSNTKEIKIYIQPTCKPSNELIEFLNARNISYKKMDITLDRQAFDDLIIKYKCRATPLFVYGEKTILGFNEDEILKILRYS
jgi:arsenate reductase-like glutaredoxin family protein